MGYERVCAELLTKASAKPGYGSISGLFLWTGHDAGVTVQC